MRAPTTLLATILIVVASLVGFASAGGIAAAATPAPPAPSRSDSHYVRALLDGGIDDQNAMYAVGCFDAIDSSTFVLLEFGAQTITPPMSVTAPGVLLTTTTDRRLRYDQLRSAMGGYFAGWADCGSGAPAIIALGTNNDGVFSGTNAYPAPDRGTDWAREVVAPLRAGAPAGLDVVGANDIEAGFSGSRAEAEAWEQAYLAVDNTDDAIGTLIYNGSADSCPATLDEVDHTCTPGWTQADYYQLSHGLDPSRIMALPQIYLAEQAIQWANIDATGGGEIAFAGALTEHGACPTAASPGCNGVASFTAEQGWRALYAAIDTVDPSPDIPAMTDLAADS